MQSFLSKILGSGRRARPRPHSYRRVVVGPRDAPGYALLQFTRPERRAPVRMSGGWHD